MKIAAMKSGVQGMSNTRQQHGRCPKPLNGFKIALRGNCGGVVRGNRHAPHRGLKHPPIQPVLKSGTDAGHDPAANVIQNAHGQKQEDHQNRKRDQGLLGLRLPSTRS